MNRKSIYILLSLLLILTTGCQLALKDQQEVHGDRLIGVFVSKDMLHNHTLKEGNENNTFSVSSSGEVKFNGYDHNKIYASYVPDKHHPSHHVYRFTDLEGVPYYASKVIMTEDGEYGNEIFAEDTLIDGKSHVHVTGALKIQGDGAERRDDATSYELKGKIGLIPGATDSVYLNKVYQGGDGRVYLVPGSGMGLPRDMSLGASKDFVGQAGTMTFKEKKTLQGEDNKPLEEFTEVSIEVVVMNPTESIKVIEMNAENKEVSAKEYPVDKLPKEITPSKEASYLLIESKTKTKEGYSIERKINQPSDKGLDGNKFPVYVAREDGFLRKIDLPIQWEDNSKED